jgi:hypothetical protein
MSYDCPDCDAEGFASIHSLRVHVNSSDDHDDWSTVSEEISHPSDSDGGSGSESNEKGAEAGKKSPSDKKDDAGEDMDVETVLDKQRGNDGDVSKSDERGAEGDEKSGSAGIPIPVKSSTLVVGVLGLVVVAVVFSRVSGSGSDETVDVEREQTDDDDPQVGLV